MIVPHTFRYFEDLMNYDVHLSMFEVDGTYSGQSLDYDKQRTNQYDQTLFKDDSFKYLELGKIY